MTGYIPNNVERVVHTVLLMNQLNYSFIRTTLGFLYNNQNNKNTELQGKFKRL